MGMPTHCLGISGGIWLTKQQSNTFTANAKNHLETQTENGDEKSLRRKKKCFAAPGDPFNAELSQK
jgi:hypothetical protein